MEVDLDILDRRVRKAYGAIEYPKELLWREVCF